MKTFCILSAFVFVGTCATPKYTTKIKNLKDSIILVDSVNAIKYAKSITTTELKTHLYTIASDSFQGRESGTEGHKKAALYLKKYYKAQSIKPIPKINSYFQTVPASFLKNNKQNSNNVLAYIEGYEMPEEVIILSAHLDHLGINNNGNINYGADDDGSGTVALMEMAQAFKQAENEGNGPKRSLLFLHFTGEELGKKGSEFYIENPIFPLKSTVANLNIDMIGRVDNKHKTNTNYVYLIGSDRLSKELHYISEKVNNSYYNLDLDYKYNVIGESNNYYGRSDHYNFAKKNIPVIFYFNGEHDDYHKHSDTPDKINYKVLQKRTQLIFTTAWQLANQEKRIVLDETNQLLN